MEGDSRAHHPLAAPVTSPADTSIISSVPLLNFLLWGLRGPGGETRPLLFYKYCSRAEGEDMQLVSVRAAQRRDGKS